MVRYKVANADEYLAITGAGIKDIKIVKASWILPFQKASYGAGITNCTNRNISTNPSASNLETTP